MRKSIMRGLPTASAVFASERFTNGRHSVATLILNHVLWLGLFADLIMFSIGGFLGSKVI